MLGIGAMIGHLGDRGGKLFQESIGKTITKIAVDDHELQLTFSDGEGIALMDDGQSCCESRTMSCDDELSAFEGGTLMGLEIRDFGETEGEYGDVHEQEFLVITTSKGQFTVVNHNEHNGYYGGFCLIVKRLKVK